MRKPCTHGIILPRSLRCDKGYVQVLLKHEGRTLCRNFGLHTRDNQELAQFFLSDQRKLIKLGKLDLTPEPLSKDFNYVAESWLNVWKNERDSSGKVVHSVGSQYRCKWTLDRVLVPWFGQLPFDTITALDVYKWRQDLVKSVSGTTANRYQDILSSLFASVPKWVKTQKIKPAFKLPKENPCDSVEKAQAVKRERILTKYEAKKLRLAFENLQDPEGWNICKLALKTVLSLSDLKALEVGDEIDTKRSKTGVAVNIPVIVTSKPNFKAWKYRWTEARKAAGLSDLQFRDLRKTGINWLKGRHDLKLISEYAGHADIKTTEGFYTVKQAEYLEPLAKDLEQQVEEI